jgi:hypothetical protein
VQLLNLSVKFSKLILSDVKPTGDVVWANFTRMVWALFAFLISSLLWERDEWRAGAGSERKKMASCLSRRSNTRDSFSQRILIGKYPLLACGLSCAQDEQSSYIFTRLSFLLPIIKLKFTLIIR